jgi:signal peptidase II
MSASLAVDANDRSPASFPTDSPETSPAPAAASPAHSPPPVWFLGTVGALTFAADALSKLWAVRALESGSRDVVTGWIDLTLTYNEAAAWSLLRDWPIQVRRPLLVAVPVVALFVIVALYRRLADSWQKRAGFALILGAALGNLLDRLRGAGVVDFIHAHARWGGVDHHWPTFNVADVAILVGTALLVIPTARRARRS